MLQRHRQGVAGAVRQAASEHFPAQHAEAVEVGAAVHLQPARLFRRHVGGAADREPGRRQPRVATAPQGDAEVREQRTFVLVEQHVLGLDVAMHDAADMRVVQGIQQVAQDRGHARLVAAQVALGQVPARQVRHRIERQPVLGAADLVDADDVRMLQARDGARLVLEAAAADFVGERFGEHHLQRDLAPQRHLFGEVDGRHPAVPDDAQQAMARDLRHLVARGVACVVHGRPGRGVAPSIRPRGGGWEPRWRAIATQVAVRGALRPAAAPTSAGDSVPPGPRPRRRGTRRSATSGPGRRRSRGRVAASR